MKVTRHAAFLRGINLGNRRVGKEQLCTCFEAAGFVEVVTFRASGNVIFGVEGRASEASIRGRAEQALEQGLGFDVTVFPRTAKQLRAIAACEPFGAVPGSQGKQQVALLTRAPGAAAVKRVLALQTPADRLAVHGREFYWLPSGRMSESTLDLKAAEAALGRWTMRTQGTMELIATRFFGS